MWYNIKYKKPLEPYIVTAELINLIREQSAATPVEAEVTGTGANPGTVGTVTIKKHVEQDK